MNLTMRKLKLKLVRVIADKAKQKYLKIYENS